MQGYRLIMEPATLEITHSNPSQGKITKLNKERMEFQILKKLI
jgi:hypothetical protein